MLLSLAVVLCAVGAMPALASSWAGEVKMVPCGDAQVSVVQPPSEYNSWPMMQAFGGRVVCAYSRGSEHTISEGRRNTYARTSLDGSRTWGPEVCVAGDAAIGEVAEGCGVDGDGAMLLWVRCWGTYKGHDVYRMVDGAKFEKIASLSKESLSPMPM